MNIQADHTFTDNDTEFSTSVYNQDNLGKWSFIVE